MKLVNESFDLSDPNPLIDKEWKQLDDLAYHFVRAYRCMFELDKAVEKNKNLRGHVDRHGEDLHDAFADVFDFFSWDGLNDIFVNYYEDNGEGVHDYTHIIDEARKSVGA